MDGDTGTDASVTWRLLNKIKCSHPCALDPGNPCRDDGIPQALVYKDESSSLGTQSWKLQLPESRSWSFANWVPKPELGNQRKVTATEIIFISFRFHYAKD